MPKVSNSTKTRKALVKSKKSKDPLVVSQASNQQSLARQKTQTGTTLSRNGKSRVPMHSPATKAVCGMSNPFCDEAIGARYADAAASRSLPYTLRSSATLGTGAGGAGSLSFKVCPQGLYVIATTGATNASQTTQAGWTLLASLPTGFDEARITGFGLKACNLLPVNTSAGLVRVLTHTEPVLVNTVYDVGAFTYSKIETTAWSPGATIHWIAKPTDPMRSRAFLPSATTPGGDTLDAELPGWQSPTIAIFGAPIDSAVAYIEVVVHFEFTVLSSSTLTPYLRPAPPPNPHLTGAANKIAQNAPNTFFNTTTQAVDDFFSRAANLALSKASSWIAENGVETAMDLLGGLMV